MNIGIIGAGRVGAAFALALSGSEAVISGVCSRSARSVEYLSNKLDRNFANDIVETVKTADVVLLTVPDADIAGVAEKILEFGAFFIKGKTFLHCSGALTSAVLGCLAQAGAYTGSLHPIQTFASMEEGWKGMTCIFFGYEGSAEARAEALRLVELLKGTLLDITAEAKPVYHAAACILSNYTAALSYVTGKLLEYAGICKELGITAFMPLLKNTVKNIEAEGSLKALTGPISRGDSITVAGHLAAMDGWNDEVSELYRVLGRITVGMAVKKGIINEARVGQLLEALK